MAEQSMVADLILLVAPELAEIHGDSEPHVFRDQAPATPSTGQTLPYCTIGDDVPGRQPLAGGDAKTTWRRKSATLDLWQSVVDEDPTLIERILRRVDGQRLSGPRRRALIQFTVRSTEPPEEPSIVHHSIQVTCAERAHPVPTS